MLKFAEQTMVEEGSTPNERTVEDLVRRLTDPDPATQNAAFRAIQASQAPALWHDLLTLMATGTLDGARVPDVLPDSAAQHRLAIKIYALFAHDPVPATVAVKRKTLVSGLHEVEPAVRKAAAELLGARECSQATDALIATLQDDGSVGVQRAVADALGEIGDPAAVGPLMRVLQSDDGLLRETAREVLITFGDLAVAALTESLTDADDRVRWAAAKALSEIGDPAAAPALVRSLEDENGGIRWLAAEGLVTLGHAALPPLLQALVEHSESVWLREGAHHVLRALAREEALSGVVSPVLHALDDIQPDLEVIEVAHSALHRLQRPRYRRDQWGPLG